MGRDKKLDFRDVCLGLKIIRDFLLGRKHNLHIRFLPNLAPRSIPAPQIPRAPEYKYSNQFYCHRSARDSVQPPVVAPVALGPSWPIDSTKKALPGGVKPDSVLFDRAPTPGPVWWWDGHCFYESTHDPEDADPPDPVPPGPAKKDKKK